MRRQFSFFSTAVTLEVSVIIISIYSPGSPSLDHFHSISMAVWGLAVEK